MIIKSAGTYRLVDPYTYRGENGVKTIPADTDLIISQVDVEKKQVIGPALPGWTFWDLPVDPGSEYINQDQLDELLGFDEIRGVTPAKLKEFFEKWARETEHLLPLTEYPPEYAEECREYFCEHFKS